MRFDWKFCDDVRSSTTRYADALPPYSRAAFKPSRNRHMSPIIPKAKIAALAIQSQ
jgi:hypothetical protein